MIATYQSTGSSSNHTVGARVTNSTQSIGQLALSSNIFSQNSVEMFDFSAELCMYAFTTII